MSVSRDGFGVKFIASGLLDGSYVDVATSVLAFGENHSAVYESVESVVAADADILTWMVNCATLAFEDVACLAVLSAEDFDAETLAF